MPEYLAWIIGIALYLLVGGWIVLLLVLTERHPQLVSDASDHRYWMIIWSMSTGMALLIEAGAAVTRGQSLVPVLINGVKWGTVMTLYIGGILVGMFAIISVIAVVMRCVHAVR